MSVKLGVAPIAWSNDDMPELGGETTLPPGSFYTYTTSRQCVIRMSSGVDIEIDDNILEEQEKRLVGEKLAKRWALVGGDSTSFEEDKENPTFAGGTYGNPVYRGDAKDGFGIVANPGITDAIINTKSEDGSLREATVNFVCHNRRQLEILEALYMRPGYPILLEWGWVPYINNYDWINNQELDGHGISYHTKGFGSPVGPICNLMTPLENATEYDLIALNIKREHVVHLEFVSGIEVIGVLKKIHKKLGKNVLMTFENCTVTSPTGDVLFQPEWGIYDMAVGLKISSVFSGSADKTKFDVYPSKSEETAKKIKYSEKTEYVLRPDFINYFEMLVN